MKGRRKGHWVAPLTAVAAAAGLGLGAGSASAQQLDITPTPAALVAQVEGQPAEDAANRATVPMAERGGGVHEHAQTFNTGRVNTHLGFDITNAYYFRGIIQENQGFIIQPYGSVGFQLTDEINIGVGIWNSFHDGPSGTGGATTDPQSWYEADIYFAATIALPANLEGSVTYTWYTSPNDSFATVHEIALGLAWDDSEFWTEMGMDGFALAPSAVLAFETQNSAFGPDEGIYLQLGIEPSFTPFPNGGLEDLTIAFPVTLGLSVSDYYETAMVFDEDLGDFTGDNDDDAFGYVQAGVVASFPLPIPDEFGAWSASLGVHFLFLGDSLEDANDGDDFEIIGVFGIAMEY
jgi:hypothetical protein